MKHKGMLSKKTFASISRRYARVRKVKEAVDAFEKIEKFGIKLEVSDYNRLIDTLSKSKNVEKAQEVFNTMKKRREMRDEGFELDVVTYGIIIIVHCKARKYDEALELFREMEAKNCQVFDEINDKDPDVILSNRVHEDTERFKVLWNLVSDMKHKGLLSKETFALISRRYARARKVREAVDAFEKIEKFGMKLGVPDYNRLIDTLSKSRNVRGSSECYGISNHRELRKQRLYL
ncbi:pentatricopeptide repeat-containing protein At1g71060, mitochondrial-like [Quercus robur]|uniref:pentatricopeptide repeat-containing protein At1g71060, mitochondrial-like n=1 Tax=Quercus robur TaxID=38942 RepID=UPI0021622F3C|nr:pentatricopeptide repeat-containing protein At1g71060, mitochondrial-like [Quercus robur]